MNNSSKTLYLGVGSVLVSSPHSSKAVSIFERMLIKATMFIPLLFPKFRKISRPAQRNVLQIIQFYCLLKLDGVVSVWGKNNL